MKYFELSLWPLTGLIIGSFVNVCVDRLSIQFSKTERRLNLLKSSETSELLKKHILNRSLNLFNPTRSFCFSCGHQLNWFENIPVLSYLLCQGNCLKCKTPIGSKTIWSEIFHGLYYFASVFFLDNWIHALAFCICFSFFWFIINFCYFSRNFERSPLKEVTWFPPVIVLY